jgi:hypothetical protein
VNKTGMKRITKIALVLLLSGMLLSHGVFSQSSNIAKQTITGTEQLSDQLKIFPNPSDGRFQLSLEYDGSNKVVAKVFDITGKLVQDISENLVINKSAVTGDVNLNVPRSGIYFLRIEIGKSAFTKKIIIR